MNGDYVPEHEAIDAANFAFDPNSGWKPTRPGQASDKLQWHRQCRMLVGDDTGQALDLGKLHVRFTVRKNNLIALNEIDATIYNIADRTAAKIEREFTRVVLQVGYGQYKSATRTIFKGQIAYTRNGRDSATDTYLNIVACDGNTGLRSTIAKTLARGSVPADTRKAILEALAPYGINPGFAPDDDAPSPSNPLPRGKVLFGSTLEEANLHAQQTNTTVSIQDDQYVQVPINGHTDKPPIVLTSRTGLIGMPRQTPGGIEARMLLNPAIGIGDVIWINNKSVQQMVPPLSDEIKAAVRATLIAADGYYVVALIEHAGDTRGLTWYTDVVCYNLQQGPAIGILQRSLGATTPGG